jgi:hypothetical protein
VNGSWRDARAEAASRELRQRRRFERDTRPRDRIDPIAAMLLLGFLAIAAAAGVTIGIVAERRGWFDPPPFTAFPDERILANLRDEPTPIVDQHPLPNGGGIVLARADGQLHRIDAGTQLVSDLPGRFDDLLISPLAVIASACASARDCPDESLLFGVTQAGGLASRAVDGPWVTLVSDRPWVGADGRLVEQADVHAWAASDDDRWVLVHARAGGLGLFDNLRSAWVNVDDAVNDVILAPASDLRFIRYAFGSFFLAGSFGGDGLLEFRPDPTQPSLTLTPGVPGEVLDVTRAAAGELLMLVNAPCERDGGACTTIRRMMPGGPVEVIAGERARYEALSASGVAHVVTQGDALIAFGAAGIYRYDTLERSWARFSEAGVTADHVSAAGDVVHAATSAGVFVIRGGRVEATYPTRGRVFTQLVIDAAGVVHGLTNGGLVVRVADAVTVSFTDPALPSIDRFSSVAASGARVLSLGRDGAMVLDPAARRMTFIATAQLPPSLRAEDAQVLSVDGAWWVVGLASGAVGALSFSGDHPNVRIASQPVGTFPAPLRSVAVDVTGLRIVDARGVSYFASRAAPGTARAEIGAALPSVEFTSVDASGVDLLFAAADAIWRYESGTRSWAKLVDGVANERITDLATGGVHQGDGMVIVTDAERAYVRAGDRWRMLVGMGDGPGFASSSVSDALAFRDSVWIAGDGRVIEYAFAEGRITRAWGGAEGTVTLLGELLGAPVWFSGGAVRVGNRVVTPARVRDAWPTPEGGTLTLIAAGDEGGDYLRAFDRAFQTSVCSFYGANPPTGEIIDAESLPDGRVFVITTTGSAVYDPANHRWVAVATETAFPPDARLHTIEANLLAVTARDLRFVPLAGMPTRDSCDRSVITVPWSAPLEFTHVTIDEANARVALLRADGSVASWSNGGVSTLLPPPSDGPATGGVRRVGQIAGEIWFLTDGALWFYRVADRVWRSVEFERRAWTEIDALSDPAGAFTLTFWEGNRAWGASIPAALRSGQVPLTELTPASLPRVTADPATLIDVTRSGERATFLFESVSVDWNETQRSIAHEWQLPSPSRSRTWVNVQGIRTLVEGNPDAPTRLDYVVADAPPRAASLTAIAFGYEPRSDRAFAIDAAGRRLWRIDAEGALWRCALRAGVASPTGCEVVAVAPLDVAPTSFQEAVRVGDTFVLVRGAALARLDQTRRVLSDLPGPTITSAARWFQTLGAVFVWEGPGRGLWRIPNRGNPVLLTDVAHHVGAVDTRVIVASGEGVRVIRGAGALEHPFRGEDDETLQGVAWDATLADFVAFDPLERTPRRAEGAAALPLDVEFDWPTDLTALLSGSIVTDAGESVDGWWYQTAAGVLDFVFVTTCFEDKPPPPMPPYADRSAFDAPLFDVWSFDVITPAQPSGVPETAPPAGEFPWRIAFDCPARFFAVDVTLPTPLRAITVRGDDVLAWLDGQVIAIDRAGRVRAGGAFTHPWPNVAALGFATQEVRSGIVPRGNVNEVFPAAITTNPTSGTRVFDGVRSVTFADGVTRARETPWSTPFVRWNRPLERFTFAAETSVTASLAPTEAIRDGLFVSDHPGRSAFLGEGRFARVNAFGLWWHDAAGLPTWRVNAAFPPAIGLAHGEFLLATQQVNSRSGVLTPESLTRSFAVGDLRFEETLRGGGVQATVLVSGAARTAFAERGFAFDRRRGLAWEQDRLWLVTDVGLTPVAGVTGFDAGPVAAIPIAVALDRGVLHARAGDAWFVREGGAWRTSSAPFLAWTMLSTPEVTWRRDGAVTFIESSDAWRVARRGLAFEADRLIAAAASPEAWLITTGIGTLAPAAFADLSTPQPPADARSGARRLDAVRVTADRWVLWGEWDGGVEVVWSNGWVDAPTADPPWRTRLAAEVPGIRIRFANGAPIAETQVTPLGGGSRWAAFSWVAGARFPFDHATAAGLTATAGDARVFIGTRAGVKRFGVLTGYPLQALHDVTPVEPGASPRQVTTLGRPVANPTVIAAGAGEVCGFFAAGSAAAVACPDPTWSARLHVLDTPFWVWQRTPDAIIGAYRLANAPDRAIPVPDGGRFPHDDLARVLDCAGHRVELWRDRDVMQRFTATQRQVEDVANWRVNALHCQPAPAALGSGTLAPGVYLQGADATLLLTPAGWVATDAAVRAAVTDRLLGRVAFDAERYRVGLRDGVLTEELRGIADAWRAIPWLSGRSSVDVTLAVAIVQGRPWRLTPAGWVSVTPSAGAWGIDPRSVRVDTLATGDVGACRVTTAEVLDGLAHAVPASSPASVRWWCADDRRFTASLGGAVDVGAIEPLFDDPFSRRVIVTEVNRWTWTALRDAAGARSVTFLFQDEPSTLTAGRFAFDAFTSLAAPLPGFLEVIAADGWWRYPNLNLALFAATRSPLIPEPTAIERVSSDALPGGTTQFLCLESANDSLRLLPGANKLEPVDACGYDGGSDGFWRYRTFADAPATASGVGEDTRVGERTLVAGRWSDLRITGAPVLARNATGNVMLAPTSVGAMRFAWPNVTERTTLFRENPRGVIGDARGVTLLANDTTTMLGTPSLPACPGWDAVTRTFTPDTLVLKAFVDESGRVSVSTSTLGRVEQRTFACVDTTVLPWTIEVATHGNARSFVPPARVCITAGDVIAEGPSRRAIVIGRVAHETPTAWWPLDDRVWVLTTDQDVYRVSIDAVHAATQAAASGARVACPP